MPPISLYLHIPFCQHRCSYCDFNTYTTLGDLQADYVLALEREIREVGRLAAEAGQLRPVETMFFGGGTPSLLTVRQVQRLLAAVADAFGLTADAEITLEANPETVDQSYLQAIRAAGINRLSMGMQSAVAAELALLGRTHGLDTVRQAVEYARAAGFDNFNLDLIYGLPAQDLADWTQSLSAALAMNPAHLSLYCLTIEAGTPLQQALHRGQIVAPDPDTAAEQYELSGRLLAEAGYDHYEISNWARPGRQCRHNLAYWRDHDYLGLGAGAHGKVAGMRYALVRRPRTYIRRMMEGSSSAYPLSAALAEAHQLDESESMSDRVIMQLRLLEEGLDLASFEGRFGRSLDDAYRGVVKQLETWDLLRRDGSRLLLTDHGRFLSNQVFYRFI